MTTRFPTTTHTAGTTYSRAGLYKLPAGTWSAAATVKTAGGTLVQALAVNLSELGSPDVDGNTHSLSVLATAAETAAWPLQQLLCDIIFTDASIDPVKVPAVTVAINVSAHTVPLSDADNPLQTISGDMAPVLRGDVGPAGADADIAADTHAAPAKTAPDDADEVPLVDSEASHALKKLTIANLKSATRLDAYARAAYRSGKDANGLYVTTGYKRADGTKISESVLSGGTSPEYTTRTETLYALDGTTVTDTLVFTLAYTDGVLTSEDLA